MKVFFAIIFLNSFFSSFSQSFKGCLLDDAKSYGIPYATIKNCTNHNHTLTSSDKKGRFIIPAHVGDTLIINHPRYKEKQFKIVTFDSIRSILLKPKVNLLKEVVVFPSSKKRKLKKIGYKKGILPYYSEIELNTTYALRIKNNKKYKLYKIEIPIKFNKNLKFNNQGEIGLQLCKNINNQPLELIPISQEYYSDITQNKKHLVFTMSKPIQLPDEDFFIVFKRIIPDEIFKTHLTYGVNPLLSFKNKGKRKDLYIKGKRKDLYARYYTEDNLNNKWVDYQDYIKNLRESKMVSSDCCPSPLYSFQLTVKELSEK